MIEPTVRAEAAQTLLTSTFISLADSDIVAGAVRLVWVAVDHRLPADNLFRCTLGIPFLEIYRWRRNAHMEQEVFRSLFP